MSNPIELRLLAFAIGAALSTAAGAQGIAQLPAGPVKQVAASAGRAGVPSVAGQSAASAQSSASQQVVEEQKPRNPLEEISRLNSEIASLKARLQIADIKSQIKKKEEEMNPPPPKKEKESDSPKPVPEKREEAKPVLPPLPNLNALLNPVGQAAATPAGAPQMNSQGIAQQQAQQQGAQTARMDPQLISVEGVGDELKAELITDWGGWAQVGVGDRYYDWKVEEIKISGVTLSKGSQRLGVAMTNSRVTKMQTQAMLSRNMSVGAGAMGGMGGMAPMVGPTFAGSAVIPGMASSGGAPIGQPLSLPSGSGDKGVISAPPTKSPFP